MTGIDKEKLINKVKEQNERLNHRVAGMQTSLNQAAAGPSGHIPFDLTEFGGQFTGQT